MDQTLKTEADFPSPRTVVHEDSRALGDKVALVGFVRRRAVRDGEGSDGAPAVSLRDHIVSNEVQPNVAHEIAPPE